MSFSLADLGPLAAEALADRGPGRIIAGFRRCFYLESAHGWIACIGRPEIGRGPLNARVAKTGADRTWLSVRPGEQVTVTAEGIGLSGGARLATDGAEIWRVPAPPPNPDPGLLRESLGSLREWVAGRGGHDHGLILPAVLGMEGSEAGFTGTELAMLRRLRQGVDGLAGWLARVSSPSPVAAGAPPQARGSAPQGRFGAGVATSEPGRSAASRSRMPSLPATAAALIGLGPGLTPAGDDFLGGVLLALHAIECREAAEHLGRWVLAESPGRTGPISRAHLRAAARSMGAEPVMNALHALLTPGTPGLDAAMAAAARIGHSSGLDTVAGAAVVLARRSDRSSSRGPRGVAVAVGTDRKALKGKA